MSTRSLGCQSEPSKPRQAAQPSFVTTSIPVGTIQGSSGVDTNSGQATYKIPIIVPPGAAGMEPNLAVQYNSSGGNGLLGMRWALGGLSSVRMCSATIADDGYAGPKSALCLDANRLRLESGDHGVGGSTYKPRRDTFERVELVGDISALPGGEDSYFFNAGNGAFKRASSPLVSFDGDPHKNYVQRFLPSTTIDHNGDGRLDLLLPKPAELGEVVEWQFVSLQGEQLSITDSGIFWPVPNKNSMANIASSLDADGDGLADLVFRRGEEDLDWAHDMDVLRKSGPRPDVITTITNGLGAVTGPNDGAEETLELLGPSAHPGSALQLRRMVTGGDIITTDVDRLGRPIRVRWHGLSEGGQAPPDGGNEIYQTTSYSTERRVYRESLPAFSGNDTAQGERVRKVSGGVETVMLAGVYRRTRDLAAGSSSPYMGYQFWSAVGENGVIDTVAEMTPLLDTFRAIDAANAGDWRTAAANGASAPYKTAMFVATPGARSQCFAAGTLVHTDAGTVPIEQIRLGDRVWAKDDSTGEVALQAVTALFETPNQPLLELSVATETGDVETLRVTASHPFWVRGRGWIDSHRLKPGDQVFTLQAGWLRVSKSTAAQTSAVVYNFSVAEFESYFVGELGTWVHNTPACGGAYGLLKGKVSGGEVHHLISSAALKSTPVYATGGARVTKWRGPSIRMSKADHKMTASHPSYKAGKGELTPRQYRARQADLIKQGKVRQAIEEDVAHIRRKFPDGRYEVAIQEALQYATELGF